MLKHVKSIGPLNWAAACLFSASQARETRNWFVCRGVFCEATRGWIPTTTTLGQLPARGEHEHWLNLPLLLDSGQQTLECLTGEPPQGCLAG
jgi:hypothetical protein